MKKLNSMDHKIKKSNTGSAFKDDKRPPPRRLTSIRTNAQLNVSYSGINIQQYVNEMSLCPSEAIALNPSQFPLDTFELLGKGPMNFLILSESEHYNDMFLYLSKQANGETFGCTDDPLRVILIVQN